MLGLCLGLGRLLHLLSVRLVGLHLVAQPLLALGQFRQLRAEQRVLLLKHRASPLEARILAHGAGQLGACALELGQHVGRLHARDEGSLVLLAHALEEPPKRNVAFDDPAEERAS